jgi:hypothetical protein
MNPIPGVAGVDYPTFSNVPDTGFDCEKQNFPGIYSDTGAQCQVGSRRCKQQDGHTAITMATVTVGQVQLQVGTGAYYHQVGAKNCPSCSCIYWEGLRGWGKNVRLAGAGSTVGTGGHHHQVGHSARWAGAIVVVRRITTSGWEKGLVDSCMCKK